MVTIEPVTASAARHYDVTVVGAGPVGAVAALARARRGVRVALCEANPSAARRLAGEWLHPPAIQVLRELGIDLPSEVPEHAAGRGFVVFPDDGSAPCLLPYGIAPRVIPFAWAFSGTIGRALRGLGGAAWRSGQWDTPAGSPAPCSGACAGWWWGS